MWKCCSLLRLGLAVLALQALQFLVHVKKARRTLQEKLRLPQWESIVETTTTIGQHQLSLSLTPPESIVIPAFSSPTASRHHHLLPLMDRHNWLEHIQLGKWLGNRALSDVFEVVIQNGDGHWNKDYLIKFTHHHDGKHPNHADDATIAYDIVERLSPHPSIPETLLMIPSTPNPFCAGNLTMTSSTPQDRQDALLKNCKSSTPPNVSVTVCERIRQTHSHYNPKTKVLDIPADKVPCFWKELFETMRRVHRHKVMLRDTKLDHLMLRNGTIVFLDWNSGMIFHQNKTELKKFPKNYRHVSPPEVPHVHEHDVRKFAKRMGEYLDHQHDERQRLKAQWKKEHAQDGTKWSTMAASHNLLSTKDAAALRALQKRMLLPFGSSATSRLSNALPTFSWLLRHHPYFTANVMDKSCPLVW